MSVCLFAMHLDRVRASAAKLSRNPPLIPEKVVGYFFPGNFKSFPPPQRPPSVSNQWNCSIPFSSRGQIPIGFRGCWVRIWAPFSWNPIGWPRPNQNSFFEKSLNLNWMVAEIVLVWFLEAASSNLISYCLEIVLVKLEPTSDKQFDPFRPAVRKTPHPPSGKYGNLAICGRKVLNSLPGSKSCESALGP